MLINTIVNEGQAGLDTLLSSMTRGEDDMQLNDALLEYLNDLVRSQQDKVDSQIQQQGKQTLTSGAINQDTSRLSHAPNHSKEQIEEIIDLNDPAVRTEAEQELEAQTVYQVNNSDNKLQSPAEQLLTLLKLLRERVKVEATFRSSEEHTRYLKILAACLHPSTVDVQLILMRSLGNSLEAMDQFGDLLRSSIQYAESTSHELSPSKKTILNLSKLKHIQRIFLEFQSQQHLRMGHSPSFN